MAGWKDTIKELKPSKSYNTQGLTDSKKYILATEVAKDTASASDQELNDHQMEALVDSIYDEFGHDEANTGRAARGQTGLRGILDTLDSGWDYGLDVAGDAVDYAFDNTIGEIGGEWGVDGDGAAANWFDGDDAAGALDAAATFGLMAIPGVGIPLAVAKAGVQSSDDIADAVTGTENLTGAELDDTQRLIKGLSGALNVGTSIIPGAGKAASTASKGAFKNLAETGVKGSLKERIKSGKDFDNITKTIMKSSRNSAQAKVGDDVAKTAFGRFRQGTKEGQKSIKEFERGLKNQKVTRDINELAGKTKEEAEALIAKKMKAYDSGIGKFGRERMLPALQSLAVAGPTSFFPMAAYNAGFPEDLKESQNEYGAPYNKGVTSGAGWNVAKNMILPAITKGKISPYNLTAANAQGYSNSASNESEQSANALTDTMGIEEILALLQEIE